MLLLLLSSPPPSLPSFAPPHLAHMYELLADLLEAVWGGDLGHVAVLVEAVFHLTEFTLLHA